MPAAILGTNQVRDPPANGLPSAETERQGPAGRGCRPVGRAVSGSDIPFMKLSIGLLI